MVNRSAYTNEPTLWKTCVNWLINWAGLIIILNAVFSKVPNGKQWLHAKNQTKKLKNTKVMKLLNFVQDLKGPAQSKNENLYF